MSKYSFDLTIAAVAERTGVAPATLRAWEQRYGFPRAHRQAGGHRRFSEQQVDQISEVVRMKDLGVALGPAIDQVVRRDGAIAASLFAEVHRRWPAESVNLLSRHGMLAISRAIEDECLASGDSPFVIGSFQTLRAYRASEPRWRELARTASSVTVIAAFPPGWRGTGSVRTVTAPAASPLRRDWAVVCDGPSSAACLLGVERKRVSRNEPRRFEAIWSVMPELVRDAATIGAGLAGVDVAAGLARELAPSDPALVVRRAGDVTNRAIAYLDRLTTR
jgi:Sensory domain in DIguanylate Cyclases and Two-component system/MerR HTH family regulatory protein